MEQKKVFFPCQNKIMEIVSSRVISFFSFSFFMTSPSIQSSQLILWKWVSHSSEKKNHFSLLLITFPSLLFLWPQIQQSKKKILLTNFDNLIRYFAPNFRLKQGTKFFVIKNFFSLFPFFLLFLLLCQLFTFYFSLTKINTFFNM